MNRIRNEEYYQGEKISKAHRTWGIELRSMDLDLFQYGKGGQIYSITEYKHAMETGKGFDLSSDKVKALESIGKAMNVPVFAVFYWLNSDKQLRSWLPPKAPMITDGIGKYQCQCSYQCDLKESSFAVDGGGFHTNGSIPVVSSCRLDEVIKLSGNSTFNNVIFNQFYLIPIFNPGNRLQAGWMSEFQYISLLYSLRGLVYSGDGSLMIDLHLPAVNIRT